MILYGIMRICRIRLRDDTIDRLQEKASDLGRLERHFGREQVQSIVERSKALEQAERAINAQNVLLE